MYDYQIYYGQKFCKMNVIFILLNVPNILWYSINVPWSKLTLVPMTVYHIYLISTLTNFTIIDVVYFHWFMYIISGCMGAPPFLWSTIAHKTHHGPSYRANTFFLYLRFHSLFPWSIQEGEYFFWSLHFQRLLNLWAIWEGKYFFWSLCFHSSLRERASFFQA